MPNNGYMKPWNHGTSGSAQHPLLIRFSVGGALGHMQKVYTLSGLRKQRKKMYKIRKEIAPNL